MLLAFLISVCMWQFPEDGYCYMNTDAHYIARTIYGEANHCTVTEQAAVAWCILNRVDTGGWYGETVEQVVTKPNQFKGYSEDNPLKYYWLAVDVLHRWEREHLGESDVGRVLPKDYLFFKGDGLYHNYFTKQFYGKRNEKYEWKWSLDSPYE